MATRDDSLKLFMRSTYHGPRFEGGRVPVDVLGDLAALRELLVDFARVIFLEERTDRSRFPRGYLGTTALWLTGIEDGSASLLLERRSTDELALDVATDPFEEARDRLLETIDRASTGQGPTSAFPNKLLKRFNLIGRDLRRGERLEFVSANGTKRAVYDHDVRRRLIEDVALVDDDFLAIGPVVAVELDKGSVRLQTDTGPVDALYLDADKDVQTFIQGQPPSGLYVDGAIPIRAAGTGQFRRGTLVKFYADDIEMIEFERPGDFAALVKDVHKVMGLPAGWLDGEGDAVTRHVAERFLRISAGLAELGVPKPFIYPTPAGGIRAEWSFPHSEALCEVDRDGSVFLHVVDKERGVGKPKELHSGLAALDVAEHFADLLGAEES